jgi:hypothetical protein
MERVAYQDTIAEVGGACLTGAGHEAAGLPSGGSANISRLGDQLRRPILLLDIHGERTKAAIAEHKRLNALLKLLRWPDLNTREDSTPGTLHRFCPPP